MREFDSGATRDTEEGKLDFEGFLCPYVLERYGQYMNKNRIQADGNVRASDNWQKGIPMDAYMKSMWRHFHDVWKAWRAGDLSNWMEERLCALLFNVMGLLHEVLKVRRQAATSFSELQTALAAARKTTPEILGPEMKVRLDGGCSGGAGPLTPDLLQDNSDTDPATKKPNQQEKL